MRTTLDHEGIESKVRGGRGEKLGMDVEVMKEIARLNWGNVGRGTSSGDRLLLVRLMSDTVRAEA